MTGRKERVTSVTIRAHTLKTLTYEYSKEATEAKD
jgi:hypothetical protein